MWNYMNFRNLSSVMTMYVLIKAVLDHKKTCYIGYLPPTSLEMKNYSI